MIKNVYSVKNGLSDLFDGLYLFRTDKEASVSIGTMLSRQRRILNDFVLYKIGTFDDENNNLVAFAPADCCEVLWENRELFEKPMELKEAVEVIQKMAEKV